MNLRIVPAAIVAAVCLFQVAASAAIASAPVWICTVYPIKDLVVGLTDNWNPQTRKWEGSTFSLPYSGYLIDTVAPRCNEEYDGEFPMPDGSYSRVICGPKGWNPPQVFPTCLGR